MDFEIFVKLINLNRFDEQNKLLNNLHFDQKICGKLF